MTAYIKQGALLPSLELVATKRDPDTDVVSPVDLSLATSVTVVIWRPSKNGDVVIAGPASNVDFVNGVAGYAWQAGETDVPGIYSVELRVLWPTAGLEVFPTVGVARLVVDASSANYYPTP